MEMNSESLLTLYSHSLEKILINLEKMRKNHLMEERINKLLQQQQQKQNDENDFDFEIIPLNDDDTDDDYKLEMKRDYSQIYFKQRKPFHTLGELLKKITDSG
jgi:hypothetical protein